MSDKNQNASVGFTQEKVATNNFLMMVLILVFRPRGLMGTRDT